MAIETITDQVSPTANKQFRGKQVSSTVDGHTIVERYEVENLSHGDGDGWIEFVPQKYALHPKQSLYPGALVVAHRLVERRRPDCVLVDVVYQSNRPFSGGPRATTATSSVLGSVSVPVFRRRVVEMRDVWLFEAIPIPRPESIRVETRFLQAVNVTLLNNQIANAIGALHVYGGTVYQFVGANAATDGFGRVQVEYRFRTTAWVGPIGIGHPQYRNDRPIPTLPPLSEYVVDDSVDPPEIWVVTPDSHFLFFGPPGGPAFPPGLP